MGVQMMVFTYILGRTDARGRTVIEAWADRWSTGRFRSSVLSVVGVVVIANLLYGAVFTPHLVAKLEGWETAGPTAPLFPGVPNQPLQGTGPAPGRTRSGSSVAPPRPRRSPEAALAALLTNR